MDDTPYINDGADASLRKTVSLLNKIEAHTASAGGGGLTNAELRASPVPVDIGGTGSITITSGTVTVSNEVEVTNESGNPIPVSGSVTANVESNDWETIGGQIASGLGGYTIPVGIDGQLSVNVSQFDANDAAVEAKGRDINNDLQSLPIGVSGQEIPTKGIPIAFGKGPEYVSTIVSDQGNELPVTGPLTDTQLRATAVPVSGPVTNTQLRASAVPISGSVSVSNLPATQAVSGPLTNTELRASEVPVTGQVTSVVKYSDPDYGYVEVNNDYRLPVNSFISGGSIEVNNLPNVPTNVPYDNYTPSAAPSAGIPIGATYNGEGEDYFRPLTVDSQNRLIVTGSVTGPLTDTQLRATAVPVSGTFWQATQPVSVASALSTKIAGWDIPVHDYRGLGYTSGNLTSVTYKTGGSGGTTVATLTLAYDGSGNLTSITKS